MPTILKSELLLLLLCIRTVKATKRGKTRSNYQFLFLFLPRIREGLSVRDQCNGQIKAHSTQPCISTVSSTVPQYLLTKNHLYWYWYKYKHSSGSHKINRHQEITVQSSKTYQMKEHYPVNRLNQEDLKKYGYW